ncbi:hypothetical protein MPF19_18180 [Polaribacter sp. Z014]|uniref:hypothetical protein n=1 Tax=Polaribacter sp. Z014 TaxID=2927126 RepID=UPI0020226651|nr:hypothetical protein [Polaribacter sp. Z014]MCL7765354.1 hypothetical protein [Polaribacter sp. Z014]
MGLLSFIIGAIISGFVCYFFLSKKTETTNKELSDNKQDLKSQIKISSEKINELKNELLIKTNELKKTKNQEDITEDKIDDLDFELSKLKRENQYLKVENDKLTSTIREYEMLHNAKKDEIEKLKKQLNN